MTDPAERVWAPRIADEQTMLLAWLDFHRATLAAKCDGLDAAQLATRSAPPSPLSLLGLIRHMADVERVWFDLAAGRNRESIYSTDAEPDADFFEATGSPEQVAEAFANWQRSIAEAREVAGTLGLDDTLTGRSGVYSVRWLLVHLIEEYARHNGHADLLREAVDGSTGQ